MNFATGYAMNTNDLFVGFPTRKMKLSAKACEELIGNRHKEKIAEDIFRTSVGLILDDIIDNNVVFLLPTRSRTAELKMSRVEGDDFIKLRKAGKWQDVDFIASDFGGYQMVLNFQSGGIIRLKPIYLDSTHRNTITEYTNKGKAYY